MLCCIPLYNEANKSILLQYIHVFRIASIYNIIEQLQVYLSNFMIITYLNHLKEKKIP